MAEGELANISGMRKAAIFLMSLGEQGASEIIKHMNPKEVQKIGREMSNLKHVSRDALEAVLGDFNEVLSQQTSVGTDSSSYVQKVLTSALGDDRAKNLLDRIGTGEEHAGLEQLKWMDARAIADMVRLEHPQIIAIVLSYLDSDMAAEVLMELSDKIQHDVMMRIAVLDAIPPSALDELNTILEQQFSGASNIKQATGLGGIKRAADILNFVDGSTEENIITKIKDADDALSEKIQDLMFVFENLLDVTDRGIQALLREVQSDTLIIALKGVEVEMRDKFFKNMSRRAGEMMREDLETKGPVKLSEVEAAQKEILTVARRLGDSGEIVLGGSQGGEEYV